MLYILNKKIKEEDFSGHFAEASIEEGGVRKTKLEVGGYAGRLWQCPGEDLITLAKLVLMKIRIQI